MQKDLFRVKNWDGSVVTAIRTVRPSGAIWWTVPNNEGGYCNHYSQDDFEQNHEVV